MEDDDLRLREPDGLLGEAEVLRVLVERGEEVGALPLALDAEHHDDVRIAHALIKPGVELGAEGAELGRHEGRRPDQTDGGAERAERVQVRARHAAVEDVAHDGDRQPRDAPEVSADRQQIEERLGRVLVTAVAGIEDRAAQVPGEEVAGPGGGMADDDRVGSHRLEVPRRVRQRLALAGARGGGADVDGVRREAFRGDLERGASARAHLVEQVDHRFAA